MEKLPNYQSVERLSIFDAIFIADVVHIHYFLHAGNLERIVKKQR
jgi:hypothetical protein